MNSDRRTMARFAALSGSALVFSAHVGTNDKCFEKLMALHVPDGATVADVTYGRGNFWKCVAPGKYNLKATDIADGVDCRKLPYGDETIDAVVLDPPYVAGFFRPRKIGEAYQDFTHRYSADFEEDGPRYHDGVLALYRDAANEAHRVLKPGGVLVLKCQDEVHAGRQYLTHVEIVNALAPKYHAKDLFVVVRRGGNFATRGRAKQARQHHARKNHSYFLVFEKHWNPDHETLRSPAVPGTGSPSKARSWRGPRRGPMDLRATRQGIEPIHAPGLSGHCGGSNPRGVPGPVRATRLLGQPGHHPEGAKGTE